MTSPYSVLQPTTTKRSCGSQRYKNLLDAAEMEARDE